MCVLVVRSNLSCRLPCQPSTMTKSNNLTRSTWCSSLRLPGGTKTGGRDPARFGLSTRTPVSDPVRDHASGRFHITYELDMAIGDVLRVM